ncbi:hypothetical protein BCR39DRAFT_551330 [Naematelia encephala]|uniref:Pentacotripeptide-repeat region of PRORP domain-containing protein n=1 Tax=Naematelia encephala TaxID=71784 RepID=A0A1Y2AK24_9TREE|nr:hypothetical protein BCR39DRAFT_551330 [Naematelia encephala]
MSSSYIASLAFRGRGKIAPATFSHVLQLVRAYGVAIQGLEAASSATATYSCSKFSTSTTTHPRVSQLRRPTRRHYASAKARDAEDDDHNRSLHSQPVDDRPPDPAFELTTHGASPVRIADESSSSSSNTRTQGYKAVLFHRQDRTLLPKDLQALLGTKFAYSPTDFRRKVQERGLKPSALSSHAALAAVMTVFFRRGSKEEWEWMLRTMEDILETSEDSVKDQEGETAVTNTSKDKLQAEKAQAVVTERGKSVRSVALVMRAWAMLQLVHFSPVARDELDLTGVEAALEEALSARQGDGLSSRDDLGSRGDLGSRDGWDVRYRLGSRLSPIFAFEHAVAGIVLASIGRFEQAKQEMLYALIRSGSDFDAHKDRVEDDGEPVFEELAYQLDYFEAYHQVLIANNRPGDMLALFWQSSRGFVSHFREFKSTRPWFAAQMKYWAGILLGLPDPAGEVRARINSDLPVGRLYERADCMFMALAYIHFVQPRHGSWNERARLDDALKLARVIMGAGWKLSSDAVGVVLQRLFHSHRPDEAMALFRQCLVADINFGHAAHSRVLDGLVSCGRLEEAQELQRHIGFTWRPTHLDRHILQDAYTAEGNPSQLVKNFEQTMGEDWQEDIDALGKLQRAYHVANEVAESEVVFEKRAKLANSIDPYNDQLRYYAKATDVDKAIEILGKIIAAGLTPSSHTYNLLLTMFARLADVPNAERIIAQMKEQEIEIPAVNWASYLNVYLRAGQYETVAKKYSSLPESVQNTHYIQGVVLRATARLGANTHLGRMIFREMREKDAQDWAMMIYIAIENGDMIHARKLYQQMDRLSQMDRKQPKPDLYTFSILLQGYIRQGDHASSQEVHEEMLRRRIIPSSATYGSIINFFVQARGQGAFDKAHDFAMKIVREVEEGRLSDNGPDKVKAISSIIGPLIPAALRLPDMKRAEEYFTKLSETQAPDILRLSQMMEGYRRERNVRAVMRLWDRVLQLACDSTSRAAALVDTISQGGARPEKPDRSQSNLLCIPLSIVMDALAAAGRHAELKQVWTTVRDEGFGFDAFNYSHFSAALARLGDIESAFYIMEHVVIPRWEEIKAREYQAVRPTEDGDLPPVPRHEVSRTDLKQYGKALLEDVETVDDRAADTKRKRAYDLENPRPGPPEPYSSRPGRPDSEVLAAIVRQYRPMDEAWRPSTVTLSALGEACMQIVNHRFKNSDGDRAVDQRAWLWFLSDREDDDTPSPLDRERSINVHLEGYPRAPVRDPKSGEALVASPKAFLVKLKVKYRKTMMLVLLNHRKKKQINRYKEEQRRQKVQDRRTSSKGKGGFGLRG